MLRWASRVRFAGIYIISPYMHLLYMRIAVTRGPKQTSISSLSYYAPLPHLEDNARVDNRHCIQGRGNCRWKRVAIQIAGTNGTILILEGNLTCRHGPITEKHLHQERLPELSTPAWLEIDAVQTLFRFLENFPRIAGILTGSSISSGFVSTSFDVESLKEEKSRKEIEVVAVV